MDPCCFARQFGVISTLPPEAVIRIEHADSSRSWVSLTEFGRLPGFSGKYVRYYLHKRLDAMEHV
jgi:hypothetical protein